MATRGPSGRKGKVSILFLGIMEGNALSTRTTATPSGADIEGS